jgi:hypothetical protein
MPENSLVIFLSPKKIDTGLFSSDEKPVKWLYLGKQFHEKDRIEKDLGSSFRCLDISRIHNDVADTIRTEFVEWIDALNALNGSSQEWWWGSVSSRNVYRSNVFQYCCYIEILDTIWGDAETRPAFVVTESAALAKTLQKWGVEHNIVVSIVGKWNAFTQQFGDYAVFFIRWINFIAVSIMRICGSLVLAGKPPILSEKTTHPVIIHSYIHPLSIKETGEFSDRYFPYLYNFLERHDRQILVIPTYHGFTYNYFSMFARIRKSNTRFLIPERFLKITDLLYTWVYPVRLLCGKILCPLFHKTNYAGILREDTIKDKFEDCLDAILMYRLTGRLKNAGFYPELYIDWYENQAISRALSKGLRTHFPGIPQVGAQLFLHYPNFLSLSPSRSEIQASMVPDKLLETSDYQCKMATMFAPCLPCQSFASLRYSPLFSKKERDPVNGSPHQEMNILLLASFDIEETLELLSQVSGIMNGFESTIHMQIKLHPDMEKEAITRYFGPGQWPQNISIITENLSQAIEQASIVISKSSGSIVEAASEGIPVIFLGNQTKLNFNPLAGIDLPMITECYTTEELERSIRKYLALSPHERMDFKITGRYLRDLFFTDINETTLSPILDLMIRPGFSNDR